MDNQHCSDDWVYATPLSRALNLQKMNASIHAIPSLPHPVEFVVFLFGYAFNPVCVPLWTGLVYLLACSAPVGRGITKQDDADALFAPLFYLATVLATLLSTEVCKSSFSTTRPSVPTTLLKSGEVEVPVVRRYGALVGSLKSKHSFPSGDSAQAMNLSLFIFGYLLPRLRDGGSSAAAIAAGSLAALLVPGVAFARVFYHCHYVEDCLGGAALSVLIHWLMVPRLEILLKAAIDRCLLAWSS